MSVTSPNEKLPTTQGSDSEILLRIVDLVLENPEKMTQIGVGLLVVGVSFLVLASIFGS